MLLSMPEHYTIRCGCKSKCTKRFKCKNNKLDWTNICRCKGLCETWKNILETTFSEKWGATIKKETVIIFAEFFLSYVYYDFLLVSFSYTIYSV